MRYLLMNRLPKKVKKIMYGVTAGAILIALLTFLLLFYPSNIEVTGNSRYTEDEIKSMVMKGPASWNSLLMSWVNGHKNLSEYAFMDSVDVEYLNRNSLRIHVSEKYPVGYVEYEGNAYYFDKDGMVLESVSSEELIQQEAQAKTAALEAQEAAAAQADSTEDGSQAEADTATTSRTSTSATTSADQFQPQITDVARVDGMTFEAPAVDQTLVVPDPLVFEHLYGLARMIDKYDIKPDRIELDESFHMTLYYGNTRIALGADENLEEKMTRAAAILPQITGMAGILHLEDFTEDTQNIIFDKDV